MNNTERTTDTKSVMYLSYDGLTDPIGQSQVLPYLRACRAKGILLHLVTFEKVSHMPKIMQTQVMLDAEGIIWHRLQFTEGRGIHLKMLDFGRFVVRAFQVSVRNKCAVIHGRSYFASMVGLLIKRMTGKKLIFDKRDFWVDSAIETGRLNLKNRAHRVTYALLRRFEKSLFKRADHVISLTYAAREIVEQKYPQQTDDTVTVIPCCADLQHYNPAVIVPEEKTALREKYGLTGATVLGYVGSIGRTYKLPEYFECFKVIAAHIPNAKLLFMVNNDPEEVFRVADAQGVSRDRVVVTRSPREKMPLHISIIDYGFFFITPTFAKQACSPTKQYEMLAMGKPVITNTGVGDAERVFGELNCGFLLNDFNAENYRAAAEWLVQHPPKDMHYDLSHYSLTYGADKYYNVYRRFLHGKD